MHSRGQQLQVERRRAGAGGVLVAEAIGVCLIAIAYTLSRASTPGGVFILFVGQLTLFGAPLVYVVFGNWSNTIGATVVGALALANFLVMQLYDPLSFTFGDEFIHLQTLDNLLKSHLLFTSNSILPVSPEYPGLELVAAVVHDLSGLSPLISADICLGAYHLGLCLLVYATIRLVVDSSRWATLGFLIYTLNPQFQFIDSYFTYTSIGLLFYVACIYCAIHLIVSSNNSWRWICGAIIFGTCCIVSHHVTSYLLLLTLLVITVVCIYLLGTGAAYPLASILIINVIICIVWTLAVGKDVMPYLSQSFTALLGIGGAQHVNAALHGPLDLPSLFRVPYSLPSGKSRALEYLGALISAACLSGSLYVIYRSRIEDGRRVVMSSMAICSLGYYGLLALRVVAASGAELASRSYVYILLPVGCVIAVAMEEIQKGRQVRLHIRRPLWLTGVGSASVIAAACCVWIGTFESSWPPAYARLPGKYVPGAWDRSISPAVLSAARWAGSNLPVGSNYVADQMTAAVFGGFWNATPIASIAPQVFFARSVDSYVRSDIYNYDVQYIVLNFAMSESLPGGGSYFQSDPFAYRYRSPIPLSDLTKFTSWRDASVVYSNGEIAIVKVGLH